MQKLWDFIKEYYWASFYLVLIVLACRCIWGEEKEIKKPQMTEEERAQMYAEINRKECVDILISDYEYIVSCKTLMDVFDGIDYNTPYREKAPYTFEEFILWCCAEESVAGDDGWAWDIGEAKGMIERIKRMYKHGESISEGIYNHLKEIGIEMTDEEKQRVKELEDKYKEEHDNLINLL